MPDAKRDYGIKAALKEPLVRVALVLAVAVLLLWLIAGT